MVNVKAVLSQIKLAPWYRNVEWEIQPITCITETGLEGPYARFRIVYDEPDVVTGIIDSQYARWWYIEAGMTNEALIKSAWLALTVSDEHRRRESFSVAGRRVFDPHKPIFKEAFLK